MRAKHLTTLTLIILCHNACRNAPGKQVERDTTINMVTSFNNLFLDSMQVADFFNAHPKYKSYEKQYFDFYKQRNYQYAWFDTSGLGEQARNFVNLVNTTISNLQDSSLYDSALYVLYNKFNPEDSTAKPLRDVVKTELSLTGQFFAYAAKVYSGSEVNVEELGWFIPRKKINLTALLDSVIRSKGREADKFATLNTQYKKLLEFLPIYFDIQKENHWDSIPRPAKALHFKDSSIIIPLIKNRLFKLGDLAINDSSANFDTALLAATKRFQTRMGLSVDGVIGSKMFDELNVPIENRIEQIFINMERMRWMPAQDENNYMLVNIPEYKMYVYDSGSLKFTMNVIVGTAGNSTVIFSGNLKYVVFSPYWNVPESIVKKEILPAMKRNSNYLARNNMEITGHANGIPVIRQKPGGNNSLGLVKFLFPNSYNIYLHDTPNRELFTASNRSFSHGCIRVGEPKKLAQYLLRDTVKYNSHKIDSLMHLDKEKWVTIEKPVPVVISYFTAWVDRNGLLNFRKDIYGHDAKMAEKLFMKTPQTQSLTLKN